jgi:16S rRNA (uracil1498-N3)-methyltransferase
VHRFFAPGVDAGDETVDLPRDEAEHLTRVLRLGQGDEVAVFDGRGREYRARVVGAVGRSVRVQLLSRLETASELPVPIVLAQAILKGDKMDEVVRDAVMLGVSAIQPLVTTRTETTIAAVIRGARLERWRRVALASVKQSGRALLPEIRTPLTLDTFLEEPPAALRLMLVEPSAAASAESIAIIRGLPTPPDVSLIVGPEGGWTAAEWTRARECGVRVISLGPRILRADAVPIAVLSVLNFLWDVRPA